MLRTSERGEGRLSGFIALAIVVALGLAAWNVAPVYFTHYDLKDKVNEICRTPVYKARTDERVMEMLMKEVADRRLGQWIGPESFTISTTSTSRQCHLYYEREVEVLPGWKKVLKFDVLADQPMI
jgi:hypothetical protein